MPKNKCINCNYKKFNEIFRTKKFPLFFGAIPKESLNKINYYPLTISRCKKCNLIQQINLLDQNIINSIYTASYYNCSSTVVSGLLKKEKNFFVDFIEGGKLNKGKALEVACYDGYVLNQLKLNGWDVYGCDPNPMIKVAQKNLGKKKILAEMFTKKSFRKTKFDIIFFRNLLEHLYDTNSFLKTVKEKLNDDGSIFIEIPNIYKILNGSVFGSFFHQHISYFSIETLQYLLNKNGFEIERYYAGDFLIVEAKKNKKVSIQIQNTLKINEHIKQYKKTYSVYKNKLNSIFESQKVNSICLFGASSQSTSIINLLNDNNRKKIKHVIDNDISKVNNYMIGTKIKISKATHAKKLKCDYFLIMSFIYHKEMKHQLISQGISNDKIKCLYD